MQMVQKTSADQYDDKINALQQDIARYQTEGERLNNEAATLQSALALLANQKAAIQAQIDISQTKYDQLVIQIADTEQKIKNNQDALGITIANMYVEGSITPVEMIASSKNISEYLDKQEYQSSIRDQLSATITIVKDLKAQLDKEQSDVEKVLADQKSQRETLVAKETEQAGLLSKTQGEESAYQQLIIDSQSAIDAARAAQAAIRASINRTGGGVVIDGGLLTAYPWNYSNCPMGGYLLINNRWQWVDYASTVGSDGNGMDGGWDGEGSDGYGCRQCVSYVAWRIAKETNFYPYWGNAKDFTANAQAKYGVGDGLPQKGSIAVMSGGDFGHVAWVETNPYISTTVPLIGQTVIQVSQYNYDYGAGYGMYSLMELSVDAFDHYVKVTF